MKIAVLVSNDLSFDQRVKKTAVLEDAGHKIFLVGRELERVCFIRRAWNSDSFAAKEY